MDIDRSSNKCNVKFATGSGQYPMVGSFENNVEHFGSIKGSKIS
jgi:hypothetical protein